MNPWAVILALIAVGCLIVAYKGTQDNVFSAITGKAIGSQNLAGATGTSGVSVFGIPLANTVQPSVTLA